MSKKSKSSSRFAQGNNNRLRLILYAPGSKFENDTLADYKKGKVIALPEDSGTDSEYEPAPQPPQKRTRTGGLGLMSGSGLRVKTRNLGDGWFLSYDSVTSIIPTQIAAANLEAFYTAVINSASQQIGNVINATENLAFSLNGLSLRLASSTPISWSWVMNFAADMIENVSSDFAVLFNGEAYSGYWDIAAVTASLSTPQSS